VIGVDLAGIAVHLAARIQALAQPGEILVSRTVADLVTGSGVTLEDLGDHSLLGQRDRGASLPLAHHAGGLECLVPSRPRTKGSNTIRLRPLRYSAGGVERAMGAKRRPRYRT